MCHSRVRNRRLAEACDNGPLLEEAQQLTVVRGVDVKLLGEDLTDARQQQHGRVTRQLLGQRHLTAHKLNRIKTTS